MNVNRQRLLTDEANEILRNRIECIQQYYPRVRDAYQNHYDWPNLDPLRHEISLCITLGLFQAALTLTNHFVENLLKTALITRESQGQTRPDAHIAGRLIDSLVNHYSEAIEKYDSAPLGNNINRACSLGLISKEQKEQLYRFKEVFRNALSHSDKRRTFGNTTVPMQGVRLEDNQLHLDQKGEPLIAAFPIGQGIMQAMFAEQNALDYFLYMDSLTRQIRENLFGPMDSEE